MLSPRLTNCPECANIPSLLKKIDCRLAELGNNLYNNISYMLNKPVPANDILQLIGYRRILTHKYCNPNYVHEYSVAMIASRVIRLTLGCVSKCNEPERCLEDPCDITIVPNPTTTSTSTLAPITTTTSSTSSTTSTTTTILNCCTSPTNLVLPGDSILLDGANLTFSSTQPAGLSIWTNPITMLPACLPPQTLNTVITGGFDGTVDWDYTINFDTPVNNVKIQVINYSADYATYDVQEKITFTTNTNIPEVINCDGCNVIIENNSIIAVQDTNGSGTFIINAATSYTSLTLTPSILGLNPFGYAVGVFLRICGFTSPTSTTTTTSSSSTSTTTSTSSSTTTSTTTICEGCIAHDVTIGTQVWTGCNLDVTTYRNGDPIPEVTDQATWESLTTGAWCYYNNDPLNNEYGKLYNWYAVNDPRGLAPVGYHIPTDAEWTTLSTFLGGEAVAGSKLKQTGFCHWLTPNYAATDETGFTAFGGGYRYDVTGFNNLKEMGEFWSSTEYNITPETAWTRTLYYASADIYRSFIFKIEGMSVRLIKD